MDGVVTISTNLGTLQTADENPSGDTVIDSTSTEGTITAYISSYEAGDAVIYVRSMGSEDSLTVHFTNYIFSLTPDDEEILACGRRYEGVDVEKRPARLSGDHVKVLELVCEIADRPELSGTYDIIALYF